MFRAEGMVVFFWGVNNLKENGPRLTSFYRIYLCSFSAGCSQSKRIVESSLDGLNIPMTRLGK